MATSYGQIQEFCPENESVEAYLERVELYFEANNIAEDRQVAVFLSIIGGKNYAVLRNLLSPTKPSTKMLSELRASLTNHFAPKRVVIAERFRFYRKEQAVGESVADYEAELRRLATQCDFGQYLDQALRDRLVCGLRSEATQKHLLSKADLTLARALEIAQSQEAAERNALELKGKDAAALSVENVTGFSRREKCYRCWGTNHSPHECRFKEAECHNCRRKGHIARACRSKDASLRGKVSKRTGTGGQRSSRAKWVQADRESSDSSVQQDQDTFPSRGLCGMQDQEQRS